MSFRDIAYNGLWKQNAALVQLLGLCPVLAVSNSLINGLSLGLATTLVTALSGLLVAAVRRFIPNEIRNPVFILIIATLVTVVDLSLNAWVHDLYLVLGIFIPLIVTNCIVLARAEAFASKNPVWHAAWDGLMMGLGLTWLLVILGAIRELFGHGTLFLGIDLIFGEVAKDWVIYVLPKAWDFQFLFMLLPPGAFFGLALFIAAHNAIEARKKRQAAAEKTSQNPLSVSA